MKGKHTVYTPSHHSSRCVQFTQLEYSYVPLTRNIPVYYKTSRNKLHMPVIIVDLMSVY